MKPTTILKIFFCVSFIKLGLADLWSSVTDTLKSTAINQFNGVFDGRSKGDESSALAEIRYIQLTREESDHRTNYWMIKRRYQSKNEYSCDVNREIVNARYKVICFLDRKSTEFIAVMYFPDSSKHENQILEAKVTSCDLRGFQHAFYIQYPERGVHQIIAVYRDRCELTKIGFRFSLKEECPTYPGEAAWEVEKNQLDKTENVKEKSQQSKAEDIKERSRQDETEKVKEESQQIDTEKVKETSQQGETEQVKETNQQIETENIKETSRVEEESQKIEIEKVKETNQQSETERQRK